MGENRCRRVKIDGEEGAGYVGGWREVGGGRWVIRGRWVVGGRTPVAGVGGRRTGIGTRCQMGRCGVDG
jgi:hypothetical protein